MPTWIEDENGNKCSVEYFGSEEKAREALASLKDCRNCINCSNCSECSNCSNCSNCWRCSECSRCLNCSNCWRCSECSRCLNCSECSRCLNCLNCSDCSRCSRCSLGVGVSEEAQAIPQIPVIDDIHKQVYAAATATPESLDMSTWHTCGTTHCRAGWVVHLAGEAGYALEKFHNTALAAMLIYKASGYEINPCQFFLSNKDALEDMRRLAEEMK